MSFYDDASLVFLPSGGAGKNGKAYSIKPVPEYGNELVTNGGFDTDSSWTKGTGWTISGGTANCDGTQTGNTLLYQNIGHSSNTLYRLQFTISNYVSGTIDFALDSPFFGATNSNGTFVFDITPASGGNFIVRADENFIGSIDNVSVKEITTSGDFTFSRGSNLTSTRIDSNGLIEKGRENLLINSVWDGVTTDTRPTGWTSQFVSGTGTFDVTATEGQIRFQTLDASSRAFIYSPTIATNGIVVASVYVDEVTTAMPLSDLLSRSGSATFLFAYEDGVEINYSDNVQAGKRYSVIFNKTASTTFRFGVGTSSGTLGDVVLSRPQIEIGLVATEYITSPIGSTGKAGILEDSPRFDYSGGASCPSLLLEPSRTNIVPISEGIPEDTNAVTLTENYGTSPEGLQNSLKVQKDGVSSNDRIFPISNYNATLVSSTSYSVSAFVKNIDVTGVTTIGCRLGSGGTLFRLGYEWSGRSLTKVTDYAAGTRTNEILEDYGNGWWRIGFSFEADNTQGGIELDIDRANSSATTSIETYGWQLEEGSYPTSYIPNHSGGSVTREADVCEGAGTSSTFNDDEGVLYLEASAIDNGSSEKAIAINDGTTNNRINIRIVNNTIKGLVILSGSLVCNISYTASSVITSNKIAFKYKENDFALWVNGVEVGTDTSGSAFPLNTLNELSFDYGGSSAFFYGNVEQVLYFPSLLSDADLATLTS